MQTLKKLIPKQNIYKIIAALTAWQFLSVALMAIGTWPIEMAIVNTILLGLFVLFAQPYYSVLLFTLSIPFFVILPNPVLESFPMWRILFVLLFGVWLLRLLHDQRERLLKVFQIQRWYNEKPLTGTRLREVLANAAERINSRLMPWDKVAVLFLVIALFSLLVARFPIHGLKQILFIVNIYLFYVVTIHVVTDATKIKELIRYVMYSLGIMVLLGFFQYIATLFTDSYYFWQYWATLVSSLYYGQPLGTVLSYSNSWFSYSGGSQVLRMFGVLPDTHAFGVMAIFLLGFLAPYVHSQQSNIIKTIKSQKWYIIAAIVLTAFAIMASGTRGVWVAMFGPLAIAIFAYWRKFLQPFMKIMIAVYALIIVLFIISPFLTQALNLVRTINVDDSFLSRASSIYDLKESSNAGRLAIWQESAKYAALHPFGVGYGNFIVSIVHEIPASATFEEVSSMKNLRYNLPQEFITAHSLYLQLLVELGFAGLLAFILFWWEYAERLWKFLRRYGNSNSHYVNLTASIALAFIWLLSYGAFDVTILNDRVLMYMFIGLAISGLIFTKYESFEPHDKSNQA